MKFTSILITASLLVLATNAKPIPQYPPVDTCTEVTSTAEITTTPTPVYPTSTDVLSITVSATTPCETEPAVTVTTVDFETTLPAAYPTSSQTPGYAAYPIPSITVTTVDSETTLPAVPTTPCEQPPVQTTQPGGYGQYQPIPSPSIDVQAATTEPAIATPTPIGGGYGQYQPIPSPTQPVIDVQAATTEPATAPTPTPQLPIETPPSYPTKHKCKSKAYRKH